MVNFASYTCRQIFVSEKYTSVIKINKIIYLILITSVLSLGCAPTLRESLNAQTLNTPLYPQKSIWVDVAASEIRWNAPILNLKPEYPQRLRRFLSRSFERVLNQTEQAQHSQDQRIPTRFLLEVHSISEHYFNFFFPCLGYFTIFGCPYRSIEAELTLTLDLDGEVYAVSASGNATYSLYNMFSSHMPEARSVGIALNKALKLIAQSVAKARSK